MIRPIFLNFFAVLLSASSASANIAVPGVQELNDFTIRTLFTNGLGAKGTLASIPSFATDTWTVSFKNTSKVAWKDFEMVIPGAGVTYAPDSVPTVTGGFGGTAKKPASFRLDCPKSFNNHEACIFVTGADQTVKPGDTINLTIPVMSVSSQNLEYSMTVQATIPEPRLLWVGGCLFLAMAWRRAISSYRTRTGSST